ncbi:MAG: hypothetical protein AVO33_03335 [delta proteobacterium ML8_F1]|nr:MAG: hypothetical protein AVO33_03335 [delta proteobacterium ML8_F1]
MDKATKHYIYVRDGGLCYHCLKPLKMNQVNIDHYLPRARGGKDEIYNYVLSCQRCNKYKGERVPGDCPGVHVRNFIRGVRDRKITTSVKGLKVRELIQKVETVKEVTYRKSDTVFSSENNRFYVVHDTIYKIEGGVNK